MSDAGTGFGTVTGAVPDATVDGGIVDEVAGAVVVVEDIAGAAAVVVGSEELPVQAESTSTRPSSQSGGVIRRIIEP
jgi:hypothetical protein